MRQCGILMPISSLPGPGGIGSFGKQAYAFVDFLQRAGQQIWQILPLSPTGYGDSPYQSCSAFAGNPYFIDLDTLVADGLLEPSDVTGPDWGTDPTQVDYGKLYGARFAVLHKAYNAFCEQCKGLHGLSHYLPEDWYAFTLKNDSWLPDYALYMAGKTEFQMRSWQEWPAEVRDREPGALEGFRQHCADEVRFWTFLQYEFDKQWSALKGYANARGVQILGDMPIYAAADSADAWTGGKLFERTEDGGFARVAGCPPDFFSATGQLWGNPVYDWDYHRQTGYAWWVERMRRSMELYDTVRIDHFRGFDTYWAIPAGNDTAVEGTWEKGPGMDLFRTMEAAIGRKLPIVAEDLGELFDSVRELLRDSGYPGMKVLQFAFNGGYEFLPYNYERNTVVYPGTHDNTTLADWWDNVACDNEKNFVRSYLRLTSDADAVPALLDAALGSAADTAIIPMADWLCLGAEARLNCPGRLGGNWGWRMRADALSEDLADHIHARCWVYGRTSAPARMPEEQPIAALTDLPAEAAEEAAAPAEAAPAAPEAPAEKPAKAVKVFKSRKHKKKKK